MKRSGLHGLEWKTRDPYSLVNDSLITRTHCSWANHSRKSPCTMQLRPSLGFGKKRTCCWVPVSDCSASVDALRWRLGCTHKCPSNTAFDGLCSPMHARCMLDAISFRADDEGARVGTRLRTSSPTLGTPGGGWDRGGGCARVHKKARRYRLTGGGPGSSDVASVKAPRLVAVLLGRRLRRPFLF